MGIYTCKNPSGSSFLRLNSSHPLSLSLRDVLLSLFCIYGSLLHWLQHVFLLSRSSEVDLSSRYSREQRSSLSVCWWCSSSATQDGIGLLCCKRMLLADVQLGVDQELSVASLQSVFPAGWPPGIILLVQDLACPNAGCFLTYKGDQYLNMFSNHSGKRLLWSLLLTLFSLLPKAFAQRGVERIEQDRNCCGLLANGNIRRNLTFESSSSLQSETAGMAINVFW